MKISRILEKKPLPEFLGEVEVIGYEAYRPVGNTMLTGNTLPELLANIKEYKSYPPYAIYVVVDGLMGQFSLEIGYNSPEYELIFYPTNWQYYSNIDFDDATPPYNVMGSDFRDWYLAMKLNNFIYDIETT